MRDIVIITVLPCGELENTDKAEVTISDGCDPPRGGCEARYQCLSGYTGPGANWTCMENGDWTSEEIVCGKCGEIEYTVYGNTVSV